ncbi:MAG: ABC transporter substrate-binding protein, partial [Planctomycetales bacterium]|nr:ABC transporter substrate-binding protein [Planctomycetales bacterium]
MKRRAFLAATGAAAAASSFPAPAISQGIRELKLVSAYLKVPQVEMLAQSITDISGGRLQVKLFTAGELVGSFEIFDAVSEGLADMYVGNEYYWQDRSPAFTFFTTVPYGLTAIEMYSWIHWGGGQELWDELSANYNLKPFPSDIGENQMGGWYNKEIKSVEDFKGLRLRMPGLGGELMRRMGATVINLPAGEIVQALKSGALDAAEWVGPDWDMLLGLHTAAKYYYYPGIHEPGNLQSFAINKTVWDSLASAERKSIEAALAGG